mgnify:FL=1
MSNGAGSNRWLLVGLGNPGPEYEKTRHNVGAMLASQIASVNNAKFSSHKARANVAEFKLGVGGDAPALVVATLRTYMNDSGGPTKSLADFFKIPAERIIVAHDELDIPFSAIRMKCGGGDNGHNGLKSITQSLGTAEYYRIRLGIGRPPGVQDPGDFVLKPFNTFERSELSDFMGRAVSAIEVLIEKGLGAAQQEFNS